MDNPRTKQAKSQEIQRNESQRKSWGTCKGDNYGSIPCVVPKYYGSVFVIYFVKVLWISVSEQPAGRNNQREAGQNLESKRSSQA